MAWRSNSLEARVATVDEELAVLRTGDPAIAHAIARWRSDAAAMRFHLRDNGQPPRIVAVLGGTGTGKSTLVNRLLGSNVSAASFRRTFTAGPVAVAPSSDAIPRGWLGVEHVTASEDEVPARGASDRLVIVPCSHELTKHIVLIDTPDLDGDQPQHHAQADRAFRWAHAIVFLVTPEKYQMTELLPYYRLARRYAIPALFVMNKAEEPAVVDDYVNQLNGLASASAGATAVFAVPRDDAAFEPSPDVNLASLRRTIVAFPESTSAQQAQGLANRAADLIGRLQDQILAPLRDQRREAEQLIQALRAMEAPTAGVDVNPLTRQLQRRLQQRSILYLIGPGRVIDRVRQVPGLLMRLPRTTWDLLMKGKLDAEDPTAAGPVREVPDFRAALIDQFTVVQSRIEDVLRSSAAGEQWVADEQAGWAAARIEPAAAGDIAEQELADLRSWLEKRWHGTPRDTALLQKLLKHLPGGQKLTRWSEAAPYLLTIVVATHHAFFGHIDLMIIGGYTLATWLSERLSNEVASRTRLTNRRIAERFETLAHKQIERACAWLQARAPEKAALDRIQRAMEAIGDG